MKRRPSWEANRSSATQIILILWNPKIIITFASYHHLCLFILFFEDTFLIVSSHLHLGVSSGIFPFGFPTNTIYAPLLSPVRSTCPAHLILPDLITQRYLVGTEDKVPRYVVFSTPPLPRPSSSSSSLAQQPLVGPGLLKKLCPFVSVEGDFLPVLDPQYSYILISSLLDPNIILSALFSNTLSLHSSLSVTD